MSSAQRIFDVRIPWTRPRNEFDNYMTERFPKTLGKNVGYYGENFSKSEVHFMLSWTNMTQVEPSDVWRRLGVDASCVRTALSLPGPWGHGCGSSSSRAGTKKRPGSRHGSVKAAR